MVPKQAVVGISQLVTRHQAVDSNSVGPTCHVLTRLLVSEHPPVKAYAAHSLSVLALDDDLRPQAARAGITTELAGALTRHAGDQRDTMFLREVLG